MLQLMLLYIACQNLNSRFQFLKFMKAFIHVYGLTKTADSLREALPTVSMVLIFLLSLSLLFANTVTSYLTPGFRVSYKSEEHSISLG